MPSLYFLQDQGDCIRYDDGVSEYIYEKQGTVSTSVSASGVDVTQRDIPTWVGVQADLQGKTDYTRGEHGVAFYLDENYFEVALPVDDTSVKTLISSVPVDGVLRISAKDSTPIISNALIYLNGTQVYSGTLYVHSHPYGFPLNVEYGDVVTVKTTSTSHALWTAIAGLLPHECPY